MSDVIELLATGAARNLDLLKMTVADFSEADLFVRPVPGANHAAWQIGHLIVAETNLVNAFRPDTLPPVPPAIAERFTKSTASIDDPAKFGVTKQQLLDALVGVRANTVKWIKSLSPKDLDQPAPERLRNFAPDLGQLIMMLSSHVIMHLGQVQVIRRKLGKPVLF
ncbi:MAG: DinB family protein [Phycisphaerales bacterium]|jgi:hypothetical protein|nr:DinB family protein [Phycisphaerales bacterium]